VRRLNWGCGSHTARGWVNTDIKEGPGIDVSADILDGLPFDGDSFDYVVSIHALPELSYPELVPALAELRRVLKPGGVLRLGLPDLRKGIAAYEAGDGDYFQVPEDELQTPGGRFIVHMLWYGYTRTLFTPDFVHELLDKAGFDQIRDCAFGQTDSGHQEITVLDNRENESFFVEAARPESDAGSVPAVSRPGSVRVLHVLDVSVLHRDQSSLHGGHLDRPLAGERHEGVELEIVGWAVGREAPAVEILVESGTEVVGRGPVDRERPDIAEAFGEEHVRAGFRLKLRAGGTGASDLGVTVVLANGVHVPLGTIEIELVRNPAIGRR
jgi:predicted SAM-dependent methyltransferase